MADGDSLRDRLLEAAIRHFGSSGFDGAGTRAIARDCDTPMSSITYHFGGKEGLYLAVADHIAAGIAGFMDPTIESVRAKGIDSPSDAVDGAVLLIQGLAGMILDERSEPWATFIIREQQQPTAAFDRLYDGVMRRVIETLVLLVRAACPHRQMQEARADALLLIGQTLALRAARAAVCRVLGVHRIDGEVAALLRARIEAQTRRMLSSNAEISG